MSLRNTSENRYVNLETIFPNHCRNKNSICSKRTRFINKSADLVGRNTTTDATPVNIFLDGSTQRISVLNETAMFVTINIAGITSGGTSAAHYIRKVAIKNVGGTTSLIGAVSTIGTDVEDNALYDVIITADNTNDALDIQVNGVVGDTMRWTVHISGVEMKYSWT